MSQHPVNRRSFLKSVGVLGGALALPFVFSKCAKRQKHNVLFISIDDLNDWVGCMGGHPDVKTPNLDRLAKRGVMFSKAYCAAPACNPSRAALMTGIRPSTSGVYINSQPWRKSEVLKNAVTIPQHFMAHGYTAKASGKIYHGNYPDPQSWQEYWPSQQQNKPDDPLPPADTLPINGIPNTRHFDWGPLENASDEMGDWKVTDWVIDQLQQKHEKPFFMGCGIFKPHLPWFVPKKFFHMYPLESITLPEVNDNDFDDIPKAGDDIARHHDHDNVLKYHQWKQAVQGYLASISFADECLGRVLDALDNSAYRDNTIIVLWSDHGWHLGEKLHWRKFALWEEATHNVMMWVVPGMTSPGLRCDSPVNLLDIYPTLIELCDLEPKPELEGTSLMPLLENPSSLWERPSLTTHGMNNHSLRSNRWRYIQYADGSEELYDHDNDELEWTNLAMDEKYDSVKQELKQWLPTTNVEPIASDR